MRKSEQRTRHRPIQSADAALDEGLNELQQDKERTKIKLASTAPPVPTETSSDPVKTLLAAMQRHAEAA